MISRGLHSEDITPAGRLGGEGKKPTRWERLKGQATLAATQLPNAIVSSWVYTLFGLFVGFGLLGIKELIVNYANKNWFTLFCSFTTEHLGIGVIVAAIAVVFYEWGAAIKETLDLAANLSTSIHQIEQMKTLIERTDEVSANLVQTKRLMESLRLTERLYQDIDKAIRINLAHCLDGAIGGPLRPRPIESEKAASVCQELILAIKKLREKGAWANDKYIEFITKHIADVVGHNAKALSNLILNGNKQDFIVPPTAGKMAAEILSKQMEALKEGDGYDVVSDLTSWQDSQLTGFFSAMENAVNDDRAEIRRVFNVLPYLIRGDFRKALPDKYQDILTSHLTASNTWKGAKSTGKYQIKILWTKGYKKLREDPRWKNIEIERLHFGIFNHENESIKFSVTAPDLSDMEIRRLSRENADQVLFDALWLAAEDVSPASSAQEQVTAVCDRLHREME
jgi:hypothetical protein